MPICIAGVPFSGVATVARILDGLGVDVGPQEELLADGGSGDFWSNRRFARLNEAILEAVGAAWDVPPPGGVGLWTEQPQLQPLRKRAQDVADSLALAEPWGWADPRNALTLPFWRSVYPDMDVVVCIRHPLQVARSLEAHGSTSFAEGLALWGSYYSAAVASEVGVVTNSNRLVEEPEAEVDRLVEAVGLSPSRAEIKRAVATLAASDGGEMPSDSVALPPEIDDLYRTLLEAASSSRGAGRPAATRSTTAGRRELTSSDLGDVVAAQRIELENLRLELIRKRGYLEALQAQLDVRTSSDLDLGQVIYSLEKQLLERDEELATLREQSLEAEQYFRRTIDAFEERLAVVESTRLWRLGQRYWAFKHSVRRALHRETP
jgi:hypothetical protein